MENKKSIKDFEKYYFVTSGGKLFSHRNKRYLKLLKLPTGYLQGRLSVGGKFKLYLMHRLVAEHFISNPYKKKVVNHINGIKDDNRVENLEWVTSQENALHCLKIGLQKLNGEYNGNSKLTEKIVKEIRSLKSRTYTDIGKMFGVSRVQVSNIINKRQWRYL